LNDVEKIFWAVDFLFWGYFFLQLFKNNAGRNYIKGIVLINLIIIIPMILCLTLGSKNYDIIGVTNIGKCLFCITYFFSIFKSVPKHHIKKEPGVWIISGLFFFSAVSTPVFLSAGYFRSYNSFEILYGIVAIGNISVIIMHLLFIKAYLCIINPSGNTRYLSI
jgi:hypothetical protein